MRLIFAIVLLSSLMIACSKGKLTTTPKLELKSLSTKIVPVNGSLTVVLKFKDKEGDISDTFYVKKIRLNRRVVTTVRDSFYYKVPDVPAKTYRGEFQIDMDYQTILSAISPPVIPGSNPPQREPDTLMLKFATKDKGNHVSDTLIIPQIIVIRQ
jgi:hypothetical protein